MAELRIVKTPLIQKYGAEQIKIYLETAAEQVKMLAEEGGDSNAQIEIELLRNRIKLLESTLNADTSTYVKADINERNAIESPKIGDQCWVIDATGDSTVTTGAALYIWDNIEWKKVSEVESLDVVLDWADIQNKPTSSVTDIDDAVTKKHIHTNKDTVLDKLSVENNYLMLDNVRVSSGGYVTINPDDPGFDAAVAALKLPEGSFITVITE